MRRPWVLLFLILVLALLTLGVTACGGSSDESASPAATATGKAEGEEEGEEEEVATPAEARAEIGEVRDLLDKALTEYEEGEVAEAEEIVGDAYLEHFEKVEEPLGERDHELMEEIEVLISTTIRNRIKEQAPAAEVERLVAEAKDGLAEAEELLASG